MLFNLKSAAIVVVAAVAAATVAAGPDVVELTPKNFKQIVDGSKDVFVKFMAPWCGHCRNMAEDYEKLAAGYSHDDNVVIAKVNADEHRDLGNKFKVQGFPTLKFFPKNGDVAKPEDYTGGRDLDSLVNFLREKTGTASRIKKAVSHVVELDYDKFKEVALDESKFVLVEYYATWCGHCKTLAPIYAQLSEVFQNDDDVVIANYEASEDSKIKAEYAIGGFPTIIAFPAGKDAEKIEYDGNRGLEDLVSFVNKHAGTQRTTKGLLDQSAGRLDALDSIARKYLAASEAQRVKLIAKAKKAADKVKDSTQARFAKYYVKVMEKMSSASDFASKEAERLTNVVKSGAVSAGKLDGFTIRQNVLRVFLGKDAASEKEAEKESEPESKPEADRAKDEL
ncbi:disulfide isomerase [Coemansia reversa NRRL 1564]|uniref:protein disulfide-isomerase n=1 Tax=Coemansia reversa (strain ATCC 12441 / NRRL 1564) TaxID=763665 RepID=A0A2G5BBB6_COERN|nr:disulfide isomerase [Coemansia reversa NRRL 1564]|eukprot:PIA16309.1 disulfide isomerase [Coemansia reversa NRRL 1564]